MNEIGSFNLCLPVAHEIDRYCIDAVAVRIIFVKQKILGIRKSTKSQACPGAWKLKKMNAAKVRHIMYKRSYRNWDEPNKIARDQMKYRKWEEPNDLAWVQMKYGV